jgi:gamma-glutamyl:cysteine ligase YbdK (ATP-grasp superfamily)
VTTPVATVGAAIGQLASGRQRLVELAGARARVIAAGVHPHALPLGVLNEGGRYDAIFDEYRDVARCQLVCALQVHVAVGTADATLAVYNALRGRLPELAALAANAPFFAGRDTGYASVRPLINTLLPRQGIPPAIASWAEFARMLEWAGESMTWWFELRPHVRYGTLELRCATRRRRWVRPLASPPTSTRLWHGSPHVTKSLECRKGGGSSTPVRRCAAWARGDVQGSGHGRVPARARRAARATRAARARC